MTLLDLIGSFISQTALLNLVSILSCSEETFNNNYLEIQKISKDTNNEWTNDWGSILNVFANVILRELDDRINKQGPGSFSSLQNWNIHQRGEAYI